VFAAAAEISDGAPNEHSQEHQRGQQCHYDIANNVERIAPDIETPVPDCRIANPVVICSRLSAERKEKIVVSEATVTFQIAALEVTAMSKASLLIRGITLQRPLLDFNWSWVRDIGIVIPGTRRESIVVLLSRCFRHRYSVAPCSVVVVDIVGDIDDDIARWVVHCLAARARHRLRAFGHAEVGATGLASDRHDSQRY